MIKALRTLKADAQSFRFKGYFTPRSDEEIDATLMEREKIERASTATEAQAAAAKARGPAQMTTQLGVRCSPAFKERVTKMKDDRKISVVQLLERALDALEKQEEAERAGKGGKAHG